MKIIELHKQFRDFELTINNYGFEDGVIHGLIGPNGCGKSTLCKLISGTMPAAVSKIDFAGLSDKDITMTSQRPYMTLDSVYHNLIFPLKLRKINPNPNEVDRLLKLCGLSDKSKESARSLSQGQQQKLSLARAFIMKPKLIIIDECLSSLDPDSLTLFESEILRIQAEHPVTWIIVSHQLSYIQRLCDTVHFMTKGTMRVSGTFDELISRTDNTDLKNYFAHETIL